MNHEPLPPVEFGVQKKPRNKWLRLLFTFIILAAVALIIRFFVLEPVRVVGGSMEPNLYDGHRLLVNRIGRLFGLPERGTIVVCYFKQKPGVKCIKRLVGLPGDVIEIRHGSLVI
ncbi:MAG: signal peptidase I, partial [Planctomycetota bacterium]